MAKLLEKSRSGFMENLNIDKSKVETSQDTVLAEFQVLFEVILNDTNEHRTMYSSEPEGSKARQKKPEQKNISLR